MRPRRLLSSTRTALIGCAMLPCLLPAQDVDKFEMPVTPASLSSPQTAPPALPRLAIQAGAPSLNIRTDAISNRDASASLLRVSVAPAASVYSIPVTITKPAAPALNALRVGDGDKFKYAPSKIWVTYNGTPAEIALTAFTSDSLNTSLPVPDALVNQQVSLQAHISFTVVAEGGGAADATTARLYPPVISSSQPVMFINDRTAPVLAANPITVERFPGGGGYVFVEFHEGDLKRSTLTSAFTFRRFVHTVDGQTKHEPMVPVRVSVDKTVRRVRFEFNNLTPGSYTVAIAATLTDTVGNAFTTLSPTFEVSGGRQVGQQVEYPRFLAPGQQPDKLINPGDRVDTRDVRLYYFRDAHRVAEIINRNVRSLNQTGYDEAQRLAAKAREEAERKIDERRRIETLAVQAAQAARQTRRELDEARQRFDEASAGLDELADRQQLVDQQISAIGGPDGNELPAGQQISVTISAYDQAIRQKQAEIAALDPATQAAQKPQLERELADLQSKRGQINDLGTVQAQQSRATGRAQDVLNAAQQDITRLQGKVVEDEAAEIRSRNEVLVAEAQELRSAQNQFRREVAAGLADRDTYVAGSLRSIDPVTQVTISVIGEGVLQLRGPMNGINKIRRMVHQIDSPVGQVKVGIHTVQINGEHGDRMELVYEQIDKHVALSRFLVNQSMLMFRKAVSRVASRRAAAVDAGQIPVGCEEVFYSLPAGRQAQSVKYLYAFFGRDFVDELRAMDSELLHADNKMLSLHSMDTISLAGALNVAALANNEVRQEIVQEFRGLIQCELPEREVDYYRSLTRTRHRHNILNKLTGPKLQTKLDEKDARRLMFNAARTYHFSNLIGFFDSQLTGAGTMNNVQYATLRLAQTLKAQLISEMELKNLLVERSLLETREDEIEQDYQKISDELQQKADAEKNRQSELSVKGDQFASELIAYVEPTINNLIVEARTVASTQRQMAGPIQGQMTDLQSRRIDVASRQEAWARGWEQIIQKIKARRAAYGDVHVILYDAVVKANLAVQSETDPTQLALTFGLRVLEEAGKKLGFVPPRGNEGQNLQIYREIGARRDILLADAMDWTRAVGALHKFEEELRLLEAKKNAAQERVFSKRLLEQFIDEQEEKAVELLEALRAHSSNVDNYLKRLAIALEDDVNAQFYDPAFQKIRRVSRTYDVQLGQIETTTVLTNNRAFAKVSPAATMEFDLPKRELLITEALKGAKGLATEYGNLLEQGTFLAGTELLAGQPAVGLPNTLSPYQETPGMPAGNRPEFGSALESLIPDPAVYKFETGTGFEIRPVIQPDGHSIVYNFNYMYTTNVREPVRADEKHLGRVKRHFVHTDVQTSSYELREVSRYVVALKASRTSRGVPLLEDVPIAGALFRPAPQAESSLQENIILASSVIYPTLYDLMGLRWSPYVDNMRSSQLAEQKQVQLSRREELKQHLLRRTRGVVNQRIGIPETISPGRSLGTPAHSGGYAPGTGRYGSGSSMAGDRPWDSSGRASSVYPPPGAETIQPGQTVPNGGQPYGTGAPTGRTVPPRIPPQPSSGRARLGVETPSSRLPATTRTSYGTSREPDRRAVRSYFTRQR